MESIIKINQHSKTPKYKQIINAVITGVEKEKFTVDDQLPSVNSLLIKFDISRDTVVKAYDHLKSVGLINSVPGKGYYIKTSNYRLKAKVFLLFNKMSAHKQIIYDSFVKTLGNKASVDLFIYNNDFQQFKNIICTHKNQDYTHFVIIPHFKGGSACAINLLNQLPKHKLILLDKNLKGIHGAYASVHQNFETDIYNVLVKATDLLRKYESLKMIFPANSYHPKEILHGFKRFCAEYSFDHKIVNDISVEPIEKKEVYINLIEGDLVTLVKRVKNSGLKVGSEIGIISYNHTPLKEVLLDGLTVISTDFKELGASAARLILDNEKKQVDNPFQLIVRNSL